MRVEVFAQRDAEADKCGGIPTIGAAIRTIWGRTAVVAQGEVDVVFGIDLAIDRIRQQRRSPNRPPDSLGRAADAS